MNPLLEQIKFMHKIVGLGRLIGMRRKHALGLKYIRGYTATVCLWALLNTGLLDEVREKGTVQLEDFARRKNLDVGVLLAICEYLDGIKVLDSADGKCSLAVNGLTLLEEPRGLFDLLYGYEPVFRELEDMLRSAKTYGKDVMRRRDAIAKGSGELGRQLPFLAVRELVRSHGFRRVLDLGCGDLEFLFLLCENSDLTCYGIDNAPEVVEYVRKKLNKAGFEKQITVARADIFSVEALAEEFPDIEAITAIDVFHEYLCDGPDTITNLLRQYKKFFPNTHMVVAEFFKIPRAWLRRIPTTNIEHHLFHSLTNQEIPPIGEWVEIFEKSGYRIAEKMLLHGIGHGYFVMN